MKKTLTINLSGSVFHIDDDAYERLYDYLNKINRHFGNDEDAKEIVEDIESRIAEIFTEKIKNGGEVINLDYVLEVIAIMGTPEAISIEDEEKPKAKAKRIFHRGGKRLYRDADDKVFGGVCSGLGAYFNVDPVIIRIIFVLSFFLGIGSSALIYLILWIVVPKAANTAQRLEMKGEEVNIDSISKSIKEEMQDVKENFRNYRSSAAYNQSRNNLHEVGNVLLQIIKVFGTILLVLIGIPFVFAGAILLIVLFALLFGSYNLLTMSPFEQGFGHLNLFFTHGSTLSWIWIGLILVIAVPLVNLIYLGLKMIFRFKSGNHIFGSISAGLFIIGILILLINGGRTLGEFSRNATVTNHEMLSFKADTIYLTANQLPSEGNITSGESIDEDFNFNHYKIGTLNGKEVLIGSPELNIEKAENDAFDLTINKSSRGYNLLKARENAKEIPFSYQQKDSLVNFQPSFILQNSWRNQRVSLKAHVPVGKIVYLDESLKDILWDVRNTTDTYDPEMVNKYWKMTEDGLSLVNRAVPNTKPIKK